MRFQYRLRTLLVVVTLVAVAFSVQRTFFGEEFLGNWCSRLLDEHRYEEARRVAHAWRILYPDSTFAPQMEWLADVYLKLSRGERPSPGGFRDPDPSDVSALSETDDAPPWPSNAKDWSELSEQVARRKRSRAADASVPSSDGASPGSSAGSLESDSPDR